MHTTLVHVYVKAGMTDAFIKATETNHINSIQEPGNFRFDVMQDSDDVNHFILYEVYLTPEDAAAHKQTAHYLEWRETVAEMMDKPRQGINFKGLFPQSA